MAREQQRRQTERHRSPEDAPKPKDPKDKSGTGAKDQGIVRDERGQEQPADKERAQRVSKTE